MGGCNLNRDIMGIIMAAGEWEGLDTVGSEETATMMLPHAWGILVKPGGADSRDA
jgi:hypothetical protein